MAHVRYAGETAFTHSALAIMIAMDWVVADYSHSDMIGRFRSREDAVRELRRRAGLPWDGPENRAPSGTWRTCGRTYVISGATSIRLMSGSPNMVGFG